MTPQKIHAILRKAGFVRSKYTASNRVRGYGWNSPGYTLKEEKRDNPEWAGFGFRRQLPRFLPTGIYKLRHTDDYKLDNMLDVLKATGVNCKAEAGYIIIDTNESEWDYA